MEYKTDRIMNFTNGYIRGLIELENRSMKYFFTFRKRKDDKMEIKKTAIAGTLESSDAQITVVPSDSLSINIESSVMNQYGRQIKAAVLETLKELDVKEGDVTVIDKGALECTLKARIECAVYRSSDASENNIAWGGNVR